MAKIKLNDLLQGVSGSIGTLTIKQTRHGPVLVPKGETPRRWSDKQVAHRYRMFEAKYFYYEQMHDPARAAEHRARAKQLGLPVSSYLIGGYMKHGPAFATTLASGNIPGGPADGRDGADCE